MPVERVIYDSEDDDEGFSPIQSPAKADDEYDGPAFTAGNGSNNDGPGLGEASDSRSTDPELFRQFYEAQARRPSPEPAPENISPEQRDSSSLTDPTATSAKKKTAAKFKARDKEVEALTQVTTPSATEKSNAKAINKDIYDFPLSEDEDEQPFLTSHARQATNRRAAATSTKRKAALSMEQPKKKRKSDLQPSNHHAPIDEKDEDDLDLLIIPTTSDMDAPSVEAVRGDEPSSFIPDTFRTDQASREEPPASFFIAPPSDLTESQKQEYVRVSDGYEPYKEEPSLEGCLPPQEITHTQAQNPPNTESTIPYTTPSRYCSSAVLLPVLGSFNVATSSERMQQPGKVLPQSSPDELNSDSPPLVLKSTGKRQRENRGPDNPAHDDAWDSDNIGYSRDNYVPRPSRRRAKAEAASPEKSPEPSISASKPKKKRQKKVAHDSVAAQEYSVGDDSENLQEQHVPRASKRRSRAVVGDEEEDQQLEPSEESMPDTCPPGGNAHEPIIHETGPLLISSGQQEEHDGMNNEAEGLDPDFLAAMPEDIRREIISNHVARSTRASQAVRTRSQAVPREESNSQQPDSEETPQPKKRGRKKKELKVDETSIAFDEMDADAPPPPPSPPPATAKRRRGRPKKTEAPPVIAIEDEEQPDEEQPAAADQAVDEMIAPRAPAKRGRKRKIEQEGVSEVLPPDDHDEAVQDQNEAVEMVQEKSLEVEDPSEDPDNDGIEKADGAESRQALRDISNSASQEPSSEKAEQDPKEEVTSEVKVKEAPKIASTTGQQGGKVPLRVGLSKRSSVRPLLKFIRK